jgi:hypothetical protein
VACATFALLVAPVLGLTQAGSQLVADRYSYLPCMPFALLLGGLWAAWRARAEGRAAATAATATCALAVVLAFAALTWRQARHWRHSEALWAYMISVAPERGLPHLLLGMLNYRRGQEAPEAERDALFQESRRHFEDGLAKDPVPLAVYQAAYSALLVDAGDPKAAIPALANYLRLRPDDPIALTNMGVALIALERYAEAALPVQRAVEIDPSYTRGWFQLGLAYAGMGNDKYAIEAFERVVDDWPKYGPAKRYLRRLRREEGGDDR